MVQCVLFHRMLYSVKLYETFLRFYVNVIFSDGRSRAGVYCAANACIEQVIQHGEVDIFQAVKTVRRQRPQLVENMVCYKEQKKIFFLRDTKPEFG